MAQQRPSIRYHSKVAAALQVHGLSLPEAALEFGNPSILSRLNEAEKRFAAHGDGETVEAFFRVFRATPKVALSRVLGRLNVMQLEDWKEWIGARAELDLDLEKKLRDGELMAFGAPNLPGADPIWLAPQDWMQVCYEPTDRNNVRGEGFQYWYVRVIDPSRLSIGLASKISGRPTDGFINQFVRNFYQQRRAQGKPPPKREAEVIPECCKATGATVRQVKDAIKLVHDHLKRPLGRPPRQE